MIGQPPFLIIFSKKNKGDNGYFSELHKEIQYS